MNTRTSDRRSSVICVYRLIFLDHDVVIRAHCLDSIEHLGWSLCDKTLNQGIFVFDDATLDIMLVHLHTTSNLWFLFIEEWYPPLP